MHAPDDLDLLLTALGVPAAPEGLATRFEAAGGLVGLWRAGPDVLFAREEPAAARLDAYLELGRRLVRSAPRPEVVDGPEAVVRFLGPRLSVEAQETFWSLALDARGRPISVRRVAQGTLTACLVHPREVFAPALRARAHSVVVVHNHPSGDPEPSPEDLTLTARLVDAGQLLGIPLVDHVVVARGGYRSLGGAPEGLHATASAG